MAKPTIPDFLQMKKEGRKICMTTAYDFSMMRYVDKADIDIVLVGDSASMVMLGNDGTQSITLDEILVFCKAVTRASNNTFVVGDLPFMTYEVSSEKAIENAGRLMKEGLVDCIKIEGGVRIKNTVESIVKAGIPVMGHIGLTPQTSSMLGGLKVQGKNAEVAKNIFRDAKALEKAGAFAIVLEAIPSPLAKLITNSISIPTIGIGAGPFCDGQVLVLHDLLGLFDKFVPKFVKQYARLGETIQNAVKMFSSEVKEGKFPTDEYSFNIKEDQLDQIKEAIAKGEI